MRYMLCAVEVNGGRVCKLVLCDMSAHTGGTTAAASLLDTRKATDTIKVNEKKCESFLFSCNILGCVTWCCQEHNQYRKEELV